MFLTQGVYQGDQVNDAVCASEASLQTAFPMLTPLASTARALVSHSRVNRQLRSMLDEGIFLDPEGWIVAQSIAELLAPDELGSPFNGSAANLWPLVRADGSKMDRSSRFWSGVGDELRNYTWCVLFFSFILSYNLRLSL